MAWLFRGRDDCYGAGGDHPRCVKEPLTPGVWADHLAGRAPIGVYPRNDDDLVHWGCSDLDQGYDAIEGAENIRTSLEALGITSWVEQTRSKGYHVWAFLPNDVWVPAVVMRNTFLLAHRIAGEDPREVNPKQVTGGLGNYVRVPYPEYGVHGKQIMLDQDRFPLGWGDWITQAEHTVNDPNLFYRASETWDTIAPPVVEVQVADFPPYTGDLDHLLEKFTPRGRLRFIEPLPDEQLGRIDKSHELFCVVLDCRAAGLNPAEALAVLDDAHSRWGEWKYAGREYELERMVRRVYSAAP